MELRLQPKPEVEIPPADKGLVSRKDYFVKKVFEQINQYFFAGHLIRSWRPKAELIYPPVSDESAIQYECEFNRDVQNCFVEDFAEEVFLRTPPPCFVVLGKFGTNVRKLSQDIANEYGSVFIQVDNIVDQVIKAESETGKFLDRLLRLGVSLTLNFILALLSYVAHSPEARHRGYVLCGLPCLPHMYDLSVEQQLNYLFTWENKPTVFINVLFEDDDLIKARSNLRYEIERKGKNTFISVRCQSDENGDNEVDEDEDEEYKDLLYVKEDEEEEDVEYERDMDISPSQPSVKLPRDGEDQVWSELELFDIQIKPFIDLTKSRVDPQYFMVVDSRVENPFEMVQARLDLLRIWKVPVVVPFLPLKQKQITEEGNEEPEPGNEEDAEDPDMVKIIDEPPQTAFLTLFAKNTISPKFRWELSHYNYICPVSLRDGQIIEGKSKFAVVFMKYIYFLRDEECMMKFIRNPRPYVLPIRPKPPCRFFIIGYPLSGKTVLARSLASEYSIAFIDLNLVLKEDAARKKSIYKEFCRQKAEAREIIRLTAQSWRDWRLEEEKRISLIEKWIAYIQKLLAQRIEQFYSLPVQEDASKEFQTGDNSVLGEHDEPFESDDGREGKNGKGLDLKNLEVRGVSIPITDGRFSHREYTVESLSDKIKQAMKNEDYNFDETGLEVEANLFFSSLWNTFSNYKNKAEGQEKGSGDEGEGEDGPLPGEDSQESDTTINWASLLPPQSLSSLLLKSKTYTTRERRKSFQILLSAASKLRWSQSSLRSEFAKWRLPCFMDIPLCEIFLDNPLLLYKYCPEWLKERPLIPDPVDPNHPSVLEAGRKSFNRADCVTIKQDKEEVGILLRDAIEKAEKDGMRITGEVISPGGWVVDNMVLDLEVWSYLAQESIFADHVYILIDTEPELKRIINMWCEWNCPTTSSSPEISIMGEDHSDSDSINLNQSHSEELETVTKKSVTITSYWEEMLGSIIEDLDSEKYSERELDNIFEILKKNENGSTNHSLPSFVDLFTQALLQSGNESSRLLRKNSSSDEFTLDVHLYSNSSSSFCLGRKPSPSFSQAPLGTKLQILTDKIFNYLNERRETKEEAKPLSKQCPKNFSFFVSLLSLPTKLEEIKNYLGLANRSETIKEIVVTDRTTTDIFSEIVNTLSSHFIKKPRELERFELDEINREIELEMIGNEKLFQSEEEEEEEEEDYSQVDNYHEEKVKEEREDIRIYGESGPFCIVNLERNILLKGKPEFVLRYYGKLYFFWNEIAKGKFIEDPEKYAPYYSPIRCLPPVRIFVVGATGCGKTSIARPVSLQGGWPQVEYVKLLGQRLVPHSSSKFERNAIMNEKKLLVSDRHNDAAKSAREEFMNAPYEVRKFWLENNVYSSWNLGEPFVNQYLTMLKQPPIPTDFPELKYETIEEPQTDGGDLETKCENDSSCTPFTSMNQIESKLYEYVQNKADLDETCFLKCIKVLWNQEPYIRHGFVLERFPLRSSDVEKITENNFLPDLVLEVSLPERDMIARNIDNSMELWESQLNHETAEEKLLQDTLQGLNEIQKSTRRLELVSEKRTTVRKHRAERKSMQSVVTIQGKENRNESYLQEEQTHKEIDELLKKEFPNLVFNPIFETYESGKERLEADLTINYRRDMEEIDKIRRILADHSVPWLTIDNRRDLNTTLNEIFLKLDPLKRRLNQRGEFAFVVTMEMADRLLAQGYYFLSKFGRWCPVQVFRMKNSIHMFRPLKAKRKIFPVAYRNYIYFLGGESEKGKFLNDPIKYIFNEPHHPNIPLRVAVIGPPKSGKSTLCKRLGHMFDLKVITMGTALRFVSEKLANTSLNQSIEDYLKRGCFLPLSLKMEALMACLNDPTCVSQGFIFDGIPFDAAMTQSLAERGQLPFVILSLVGDAYSGKVNRESLALKKLRLPYKQRVNLDTKYKEWDETYKRFSQWNQEMYNNLYELKGKSSAADNFYRAYDVIRKSFFGILYYVENCVSDRALPLEYMCVSQNEYELRKSPFHNNCPVCWAESNILNPSSDPPSRSGLVQYRNHFYWVCSKHMGNFLKKPKIYLPPNVSEWPKCFPKILNRTMFEAASPKWDIHGFGRCPVTRVDFPSSLDWEGSWDYAASYVGRVYLCKNKEMLTRFLAVPWRYCGADTEFETPSFEKSSALKELGPPVLTSLPPIGFLEQTVSSLIKKALKVLGGVRPLYPKLTPACTGCTFVGLYLKAYNRKKETCLEMEYLNYMTQECKASRFLVEAYKKEKDEKESICRAYLVPEPSESNDSDSSLDVTSLSSSQPSLDAKLSSVDSLRPEMKSNTEEKMWSARQFSTKYFDMILTPEDELQALPDLPREDIILRFSVSDLRLNPLPPIANCLTFIYTVQPNLKLPEKFNYNTLRPPSTTPVCQTFIFNPEKPFSLELYHQEKPQHDSTSDIRIEKRTMSVLSMSDRQLDLLSKKDIDTVNIFMPRFYILDTVTLDKDVPPPLPKVITQKPTIFNPQRDYTYTLLLSDFFRCTHILRTYTWNDSLIQMEYGYLLDKTLGLCPVESVLLHKPHITVSMTSRRSIDSYMDILDVTTSFKYRDHYKVEEESVSERASSSLFNFMEMILMEKLEEAFAQAWEGSSSYDSYEVVAVDATSKSDLKPLIMVQETLPNPPLIWDIMSSPYHAYQTLSTIFSAPQFDEMTHQRHYSLLDGIQESENRLKFVRQASKARDKERDEEPEEPSVPIPAETKKPKKPFYFRYDYFHLPWTSFLTYPFSWAYNKEVRDHFCGMDDANSSYEHFEDTV